MDSSDKKQALVTASMCLAMCTDGAVDDGGAGAAYTTTTTTTMTGDDEELRHLEIAMVATSVQPPKSDGAVDDGGAGAAYTTTTTTTMTTTTKKPKKKVFRIVLKEGQTISEKLKKKGFKIVVRPKQIKDHIQTDDEAHIRECFVDFKSWIKVLKHHPVWCFRQVGSPNTIKKNAPCFSDHKGVRGNTFSIGQFLWKNTVSFDDYKSLYSLGNPMIKECDGGLSWQSIHDKLYNSGVMTLGGKRSGYVGKLHKPIFFPSGKDDQGRNMTQWVNRLWFIVNKC
jgi:hypothetical protein